MLPFDQAVSYHTLQARRMPFARYFSGPLNHVDRFLMMLSSSECTCRLGTVGHRFYSKAEWSAYRYLSWCLVVCIVCFGPILGVIAAGIEYGNYDSPMAEKGERIRACASYVGSLYSCHRIYIGAC